MSSPSIAADAPNLPFRQDASLIALVGLAHMVSHFSQLLLPPLFPWLKDAFDVSYAQLGFMLTVFFVVSCAVQAVAGFLVDRWGPRPVLYVGLVAIALSCFGSALSTSYWQITFLRGWLGRAMASSTRWTTPCSTEGSARTGWGTPTAPMASRVPWAGPLPQG